MLKKYVISLENSPRRKIFFSQNYSLGFETFNAVNGKTQSKDSLFYTEGFKNKYNREPLPGEIGCSLSHYKLLKKFLKNSVSGDIALVAEDDAIFIENIDKIISNIIKKVKYFEIICLGYPNSQPGYKEWAGYNGSAFRPSYISQKVGKAFEGSYKVSTYNGHVSGSGLYLISYEAAKKYVKFVEWCGNVHWLSDDWLYITRAMQIEHKIITPSICGWAGGSEIRNSPTLKMQKYLKRGVREKLALKYRIKFIPRSLSATLVDLSNLIVSSKSTKNQ